MLLMVSHCPALKLLPALTVKTLVPVPINTLLVLVSRVSLVFMAAMSALKAGTSCSAIQATKASALAGKVALSVRSGFGGGSAIIWFQSI